VKDSASSVPKRALSGHLGITKETSGAALKTVVRKDLLVRVPRPPLRCLANTHEGREPQWILLSPSRE
jgi:hypothetical protein